MNRPILLALLAGTAALGACKKEPPAQLPGVTPQIADGLTSPSAWEFASGVARQFGIVRARNEEHMLDMVEAFAR